METKEQFAIEWDRKYLIDGELFITSDFSGRTTSVLGYPTREITGAIEQTSQF